VNKNQEINEKNQVSEAQIKEFVLNRFREVKESKQIKDLIKFHTANKYMLMAHDQIVLKILGNIVANKKKSQLEDIFESYEKYLNESFKKEPTIKTHCNVLLHILGFFSADLNKFEKEQFQKLIQEYRDGKITIGYILSEINPIIGQFDKKYLAGQTYFLLYSDSPTGNLFDTYCKE